MTLKIVHIAHSADGGAGRAAKRASEACQTVGFDSVFAYMSGGDPEPGEIRLYSGDPDPDSTAQTLRGRLQWGLIPEVRSENGYSLFSIAYPGLDLESHPAIAGADIIHLHWPTWTVTPPAIRRLIAAGKTVFVTLHDMWMFTGGCHYASGCTQFETACMKCPQVLDRLGLASANFEDKLNAYGSGQPGFHVIALCRWMQELSTGSRILRDAPTYLIPNPIETDIFVPDHRDAMRKSLGLRPKDAVLLFGNFDNSETRKGSDILRAGLERLAASDVVANFEGRIFLASFGRNADFEVPAPLLGLNFGSISDDDVLAGIYGLADLMCFPSVEDNYPNSIVEAAACGTPSVAFRTGGMADMVSHRKTGWLVDELGDADAFADGLEAALASLHGKDKVRAACRAGVLKVNTMETVGRQLAKAYAKALGKRVPVKIKEVTRQPKGVPAPKTPGRLSELVQSHVLLTHDDILGSEFAKFPVSQFLRDNGAPRFEEDMVRLPRHDASVKSGKSGKTGKSDRLRVMAVRTFHEHHSAFSGPYQFLRHLPADRFEVSNVMVPLGNDLVASQQARDMAQSVSTALGVKPFGAQSNAWVAEWEIARRLRHEHFDVVHFIDGELNGWLVSRLPDSFFHGGRRPALATMLHQPPHLLKEWSSAAALARFDQLGAVAHQLADWLQGFVPSVPSVAVPHGIDIDYFCPGPKSIDPDEVPGKDRPFRLLAVGHWLRDYDLAFETLDRLVARGFDVEYRLICHSLDRPTLPPYVTHLKGLSDEELLQEYRDCDMVFLPLDAATANNALLEGMACGRPVMSTAVGGVPEYITEDAGRLCPADPDICADTLAALLSDLPALEQMGRDARARAETFDWRHIGAQFATVYEELARDVRARQESRQETGQKLGKSAGQRKSA